MAAVARYLADKGALARIAQPSVADLQADLDAGFERLPVEVP
ncbi:MAG: hypothetical protein ACKO91_04245 [Acidimicrobiales bacterium]